MYGSLGTQLQLSTLIMTLKRASLIKFHNQLLTRALLSHDFVVLSSSCSEICSFYFELMEILPHLTRLPKTFSAKFLSMKIKIDDFRGVYLLA